MVEIDASVHEELRLYAREKGYLVYRITSEILRDGLKQRQREVSSTS